MPHKRPDTRSDGADEAGPSRFRIEIGRDGRTARMALSGELDLAVFDALCNALNELIDDRDVDRLVIDLRGLEFMDASGLRLLSMADDCARRDGFRLFVVKARPEIHRLLELTSVDRRLDLVSGPEEIDGRPAAGRSSPAVRD